MRTQERSEPHATSQPDRAGGRPVMLATLDVPFDPDAVVFAVDSAVELGQRLIVANVVERAPLPLSAMLGYDDLPYPPQLAESLLAPAKLAQSLGVDVTRLRVKSFHPIPAMLEVMARAGRRDLRLRPGSQANPAAALPAGGTRDPLQRRAAGVAGRLNPVAPTARGGCGAGSHDRMDPGSVILVTRLLSPG